jgi:hypothetical protein
MAKRHPQEPLAGLESEDGFSRREGAKEPRRAGAAVRPSEAPSRDARCDAKRTLDCAFARAGVTAIHMRSTRRGMRVEGASIALVVA